LTAAAFLSAAAVAVAPALTLRRISGVREKCRRQDGGGDEQSVVTHMGNVLPAG
jgi:hypothetical protein